MQLHIFVLLDFSVIVLNLVMEICPPTNRSHEEDSKAFLKVGKIVGVAKYSFRTYSIDFVYLISSKQFCLISEMIEIKTFA